MKDQGLPDIFIEHNFQDWRLVYDEGPMLYAAYLIKGGREFEVRQGTRTWKRLEALLLPELEAQLEVSNFEHAVASAEHLHDVLTGR